MAGGGTPQGAVSTLVLVWEAEAEKHLRWLRRCQGRSLEQCLRSTEGIFVLRASPVLWHLARENTYGFLIAGGVSGSFVSRGFFPPLTRVHGWFEARTKDIFSSQL